MSLFRFVQFEYGFLLGPNDGRYLARDDADGDPVEVVVLKTLGSRQRRLIGAKRAKAIDSAEPEPVPTARATMVAAQPFEIEEEAESWLAKLRRDEDATGAAVDSALTRLNNVMRAHRAAAGDPAVRDVSQRGALVVRVGYGGGDQVAEGRYAAAYELPPGALAGRKARKGILEPQERLAALLSGRAELHPSEELVLRAESDLSAGRPREAALQARVALEALLAEDPPDPRGELPPLRAAVSEAANAALKGDPSPAATTALAEAVGRMRAACRRRALDDTR